jgi:NitT/TauT family transport system substrate-binding protein
MLLSLCFAALAGELPAIRVGYIFTTNHTPLMAAMSLGDALVVKGYSLHPILPKEKYELRKNGEPIAMLDILVIKSGSETATLFAQKHVDISLASITAIIAGIDKGSPKKIVSPLVLAGGGLVVGKDNPASTWPEFIAWVKQSKQPVRIGYHSPSSAPVIILEAALRSEGLTISNNPNAVDAKVILVDLKGIPNMLPALAGKQVDAAVGPEPFPQTAELRGQGRLVQELRDMPPEGQWKNYPCCVVAASNDMIADKPELVREFVAFINAASLWSNENREKAGSLAAAWIGLPPEVGRKSNLRFLQRFTQNWMDGAAGYMKVLNDAGYFKGALKDKSFDEVRGLLLDTRFVAQ